MITTTRAEPHCQESTSENPIKIACYLWIVLPISICSHAHTWSGISDPSRAIDWSNAGIPDGIPHRTTVCATLNPGVKAEQINRAIAACPAGQVVYLSAGTFHLSTGIIFNGKSYVTLRGAGPARTFLQFHGSGGCGGLGADICIVTHPYYYYGSSAVQPGGSNAAGWSSGYSKGTTSITLTRVGSSGLSVGSVIILDQANDTIDNGGFVVCDAGTNCHQQGETGSYAARTIQGVHHNQTQTVRITGINGNKYTISAGLYANNWSVNRLPGAWWVGQVTGDGIENLTVDNTNNVGSSANICFFGGYQNWVKNVKSLNSSRNHIYLFESARTVVRDNYFYGTQNASVESYGIEMAITADDLVENNIFDHVTAPAIGAGSSGVVWGYNFSHSNDYRRADYMSPSFPSHDAGNEFSLYEGNQFNGLDCDNFHGSSGLLTYFRNELTGWEPGRTRNTVPVIIQSFCRGINIIGNVLGKQGYHHNYEASPNISSDNCSISVYNLGWSYNGCGSGVSTRPLNDSLVMRTLMRWGNYDVVHGSVQWNPSEVPTSGVPYINANSVPTNHTLPPSFYLSSKPSWWGNTPWPAIGPDLIGGTGPGGHSYANPAQICYNNTLKDSNGILIFDADECYASSPGAR